MPFTANALVMARYVAAGKRPLRALFTICCGDLPLARPASVGPPKARMTPFAVVSLFRLFMI